MLPIEHYWPAEMLAKVFPEKYRHLAPMATKQTEPEAARFTVERRGGCTVYWLGKQAAGRTREP